jgi:hypothetical protein
MELLRTLLDELAFGLKLVWQREFWLVLKLIPISFVHFELLVQLKFKKLQILSHFGPVVASE